MKLTNILKEPFIPIVAQPPRIPEENNWSNKAAQFTNIVGTTLALSAATAGIGHAVHLGGLSLLSSSSLPQVSFIARGLIQGGTALFLIGKYAFLSISTPLYVTAYRFPKWILTEALPRTLIATVTHIVIPLSHSLSTAFHRIALIWNKTFLAVAKQFLPLLQKMESIAKWSVEHLIAPLVNQVLRVCNVFIRHLVIPIGNILSHALKWSVEHLIAPLANQVLRVCNVFIRHLFIPIGNILSHALTWIDRHILGPLLGQCIQLLGQCLQLLIALNRMLLSLFAFIEPALSSLYHVITPLIHALCEMIVFDCILPISQTVIRAGEWGLTHVVLPIACIITYWAFFMGEHLLMPLLTLIASFANIGIQALALSYAEMQAILQTLRRVII